MKVDELRIDQVVGVSDNGGTYSTYEKMALILGVTNWHKNRLPDEHLIYILKAFEKHIRFDMDIYVCWIKCIDTGRGYLIGNEYIYLINDFIEFIEKDEFMI